MLNIIIKSIRKLHANCIYVVGWPSSIKFLPYVYYVQYSIGIPTTFAKMRRIHPVSHNAMQSTLPYISSVTNKPKIIIIMHIPFIIRNTRLD